MSTESKAEKFTRLFWNVQFIYELVLAREELEAFNIEYKIEKNLRNIEVLNIPKEEEFINRTAYFEVVRDKPSLYSRITQANITRSINQYLTHWFYPYKGKYHPQMIRALLNIMQIQPGERILDSFLGSGTTALETQLLGINCVGIDISEVCVRVSRAKTKAFRYLDEIEQNFDEVFRDLSDATKADNSDNIENLVDSLTQPEVHNFYKVAELIAHSDKARRKRKNFTDSFLKNAEKMVSSLKDYKKIISESDLSVGEVEINRGNSKNLNLKDETIDGIICSPPYSIALNYVENDKHALEALGYDTSKIKEEFIGVRGKGNSKIEIYNQDLAQSYSEMDRVLKPGRFCTIVIGNATVDKKEVNTVEYTIQLFEEMGYTLVLNVDKIIFGLYNVMQKENILVFRKQ